MLAQHSGHFLSSLKTLLQVPPPKKGKALVRDRPQKPKHLDLGFLKEYILYKLEDKVKRLQEKTKEMRLREIKAAKKSGALFECPCCFEPECLLKEVAMCEAGCLLCRDCVGRGLAWP